MEKKVTVHIWDTTDLPKYHSIITHDYRCAVCAFILYDITNQESFNNLDYWLNDIKTKDISKYCIIVLIGNKSDDEKK